MKWREVELDSHRELDNHLSVQRDEVEGGRAGLSQRAGQSSERPEEIEVEGGRAGLSQRAGQSSERPEEMKWREAELDSHRELDNHLSVQKR